MVHTGHMRAYSCFGVFGVGVGGRSSEPEGFGLTASKAYIKGGNHTRRIIAYEVHFRMVYKG